MGDFVVSLGEEPDDIVDPGLVMTLADTSTATAEEEALPTGSVASMNVASLQKYARVKRVDIARCTTRMDLIRTLAPELFGGKQLEQTAEPSHLRAKTTHKTPTGPNDGKSAEASSVEMW